MANSNSLGQVMGVSQDAQQQATAPGSTASIGTTTVDGLKQGMQLASMQQQQQLTQQDIQKQQDQLDTAKFTKLNGFITTLARSRPEIAQKMIPQMKDDLGRSGMNVDPGILDLYAKDDAYKARAQSLSTSIQQLASDPQARQQYLAAAGDVGMCDTAQNSLFDAQKTVASTDLKTALMQQKSDLAADKNHTTINVAAAHDATSKDNAQTRANATMGNAEMRTGMQAAGRYQQAMKPTEDGLSAANRAVGLIKDIDSGDLNSNKTLRNDLTNQMASLVSGGRPSTVHGSENAQMDSAYSNVMDKLNFLKGSADSTLPPAQLSQLKKDITALQGMYGQQHENNYLAFRESVPDPLRKPLDNRANMFRARVGLPKVDMSGSSDFDPSTASAPQAVSAPGVAPAGQAPSAPPPAPTANALGGAVAALRAAGASDDVISQKLQARGQSPADIKKALGK